MSAFYNVDQPPFNMSSKARAIAAANNGLLFDPSDLSTLYQDAAGTTPVTAVEQPVGKIIDKSGNGNHATQSITASRPTLSARYNLLTKTEDFAGAAWGKLNTTVSSAAYQSPIDGRFADKIVASTSFGAHKVLSAALTIPKNTPYTFTARLKAAGKSWAALWFDGTNGGGAYFDLVNGVVGDATYSTSAAISHLGGGEFLCSVTVSLPMTGNRNAAIYTCDGDGIYSFAGDGVVGIYCFYADLRIGTTFGPYQRVNTSTDYDTDERYFPKYLQFSSVVAIDDYLNLPYMGLYVGGSASIVCARDAIPQATDTYIISERSTTDEDPKYFPSRQLAGAGNMDTYIVDDNGAVVLDTIGSPFSGVANAVVRSIVDSGNNLKLFKNGVLAANDNYTRSGTLTLNTTTIGASVSTTTSNYASMKLYGLIVTKSALTDAQRVTCERYLGRKSGVQL